MSALCNQDCYCIIHLYQMGFTLFTDSEGGSHMTLGSMPMREPVPASWTRTYSGSAKPTHANKSDFGFVEVYMQAKVRDNVEEK